MDRRTFLALGGASLLTGCVGGGGGGNTYESLAEGAGIALPNPVGAANVGGALTQLQGQAGVQQLWSSNGRWSSMGNALYNYIANSWSEGLQPTSYLPSTFNNGLGAATPERDAALSAAALKLASDIKRGRTRPGYSSAVSDVARIRQSNDVEGGFSRLSPATGPYRQLRQSARSVLRRGGVRSQGFSSLETTMEKLRIQGFPNIDGQVVVINVAAFDLHAYNQGRPYLRSRVIVGKEGRQTPVGRDYISNLKFSPDWTPPRSIINRDLVPALQENSAALDPLAMEIFVNGSRIRDVASYNWAGVNPNSVTMHQPAGPNAILGGVRFTLNNSQAIYLHDTSARPLFGTNLRTASSGCVRVERAKELASWLLQQDGQARSSGEIDQLMTQTQSQFVSLRRRVRVEMLYLTAWINDLGVFTLYPDTYNRDTDLVARLGRG